MDPTCRFRYGIELGDPSLVSSPQDTVCEPPSINTLLLSQLNKSLELVMSNHREHQTPSAKSPLDGRKHSE